VTADPTETTPVTLGDAELAKLVHIWCGVGRGLGRSMASSSGGVHGDVRLLNAARDSTCTGKGRWTTLPAAFKRALYVGVAGRADVGNELCLP
jgi:hypothetical protein